MSAPSTILISGASGFVGSALSARLAAGGHRVGRLVRRPSDDPATVRWDPARGVAQLERFAEYETVVHLAGENLAGGRWSERMKRELRSSRIDGTRVIADAIRDSGRDRTTFACASAVGFFGDRGDEVLREGSPAGRGFLAELCRDWEAAALGAESEGTRVTCLRFGVVLGRDGGALAKMLPVFRLGLGGPLGSGRQYMSWVSLDDVVGAIVHTISNPTLRGPIHVVAPQSLTNEEFTKAIGRALRRPTFLRVPAFALRLLLGEMAEATLLASQRMKPARLLDAGFTFQFPEIDEFLRRELRSGR